MKSIKIDEDERITELQVYEILQDKLISYSHIELVYKSGITSDGPSNKLYWFIVPKEGYEYRYINLLTGDMYDNNFNKLD